jgi:hypothetical protein
MTASTQATDRHGWIGTEVVKTRFGDFAFENGYPTREAADALLDRLVLNRSLAHVDEPAARGADLFRIDTHTVDPESATSM